ncbi:putative 60S ribosomal protein L14-A [Elsinoe fawcettii]|nr:putative 60S ribosomal protein L14-A [Elsinoe fawcettii]
MGDADVTASNWRLVEVGRVVLFTRGPYAGKLAAIVEIIDHKRVLVDGPANKADSVVPRHAISLSDLSLTPVVIAKLPRAAGHGPLKAAWQKAKVDEIWDNSTWAKNRAQALKRKQLTDFERFKVMRLRKQARFEVRKTLAAAKAKA